MYIICIGICICKRNTKGVCTYIYTYMYVYLLYCICMGVGLQKNAYCVKLVAFKD